MQLGERIFNSSRRAPVILMSAHASTLDPEQLRRAGFAETLSMPIDTASLRLALAGAPGHITIPHPRAVIPPRHRFERFAPDRTRPRRKRTSS
jgi:CheY-like chemotaxis protein